MTIKRRLQISNILMLVVLSILISAFNFVLILIVSKGFGVKNFDELNEKAMYIGMGPSIIVVAVILLTTKLLTRFGIIKIK